jgi:cytochrome c peroxidase
VKQGHLSAAVAMLAGAVLALAGCTGFQAALPQWTEEEFAVIRSLWIGSLQPLPPDPTNRVADDPDAAALGHELFFDTRFSANGAVSCSTCHLPDRQFQDDLPLGVGIGVMNRRTMPIAGTAYSPWLFWDGRKDSQWAQALAPMESAIEHGGNRTMYAHLIAAHYREEYESLFGPLPELYDAERFPAQAGPVEDPRAREAWERMALEDREAVSHLYANMGKAMAAYERRIMPGPARFDRYVEATIRGDRKTARAMMSNEELYGLRLFIGGAECILCHNGPLFTNNNFHNTGVPAAPDLPEDTGRAAGAPEVLADEFNCLSPHSDANEDCPDLRFMIREGNVLLRAFKPPSLRNVADRPPFMHAGQFSTLRQVLQHYNTAPAAPAGITELHPLDLTEREIDRLEAFLHTLSAPLEAPAGLLAAPELPD